MKLLDSVTVSHKSEERHIELYQGDLTEMSPEDAVDVLVVSAFPDDYTPTPNSLIGALDRKGISVAKLAEAKAVDLRKDFSCWMSEEITSSDPGIQFKRILCFEPLIRGKPPDVVRDIFQSLMCFMDSDISMESVAMPLVASGDQNIPVVDMLQPLFDAAVHWLEVGCPIKYLKIVQHNELKASEMKGVFSLLKKQYIKNDGVGGPGYDIFISYSHANKDFVISLAEGLKRHRPGVRIFLDRNVLRGGVAWQQEIYRAIDDCRKVVAVYSPDYLSSKMCKEEYNIARLRDRDSGGKVLLPVYLHSINLSPHMKVVQYIDCREGDKHKLQAACKEIVAKLDD